MKKEDFMKLGLDEETSKKCETASLEELKSYIPKTRFDEINDQKKKLELDVKERDKQLDDLKKSAGDNEELKKQIETLQKDNKEKDDKYAADMKKLKIDMAVDVALSNAKAKNKTAVKALLKDLDKAEINDDGTVKGLKEQIESLMKSQDSSFLFEVEQTPKFKGMSPGANKEGLPNSSGFEQRLREAREKGDNLEAIKIKQEAQKEGIVLI